MTTLERLIHSLKTAIACILAMLLAHFSDLPGSQWIIITVIVVMCGQIHVGGVQQKAYLRFLGTLLGCLFAAFALFTFGDSNLTVACTLALATFVFSFIATSEENMMYAGTLGAVTTAIILLGQQPTLIFALERFLEISLGILIASMVSQYILPIHARVHLQDAQADTLKQIRDYYLAAIVTQRTGPFSGYQQLDETIVRTLLRQRQLAKESARELLLGTPFDAEQFAQTLFYEREMLRTISLMHNAFSQLQRPLPTAELDQFNHAVLAGLSALIATIDMRSPAINLLLPDVSSLKNACAVSLAASTDEEAIYIGGFLFGAEILVKDLARLAEIYQIPAL